MPTCHCVSLHRHSLQGRSSLVNRRFHRELIRFSRTENSSGNALIPAPVARLALARSTLTPDCRAPARDILSPSDRLNCARVAGQTITDTELDPGRLFGDRPTSIAVPSPIHRSRGRCLGSGPGMRRRITIYLGRAVKFRGDRAEPHPPSPVTKRAPASPPMDAPGRQAATAGASEEAPHLVNGWWTTKLWSKVVCG